MNLISILFCALVLMSGKTTNAWLHGDIKYHLQLSMQTNDAKGIAAYVEDAIAFEYKNIRFTKNKAGVEKALNEFFAQNKCGSFKIEHQGTYANLTRHMEGIFEALNKQKFQVYFEAVYDEKEAHYHLSRIILERIEEN